MTVRRILWITLLVTLSTSDASWAQGIVPRGRIYEYAVLTDSSRVTLELLPEFADSTLYEGVDSTVVRLQDVIVGQWSFAFADSLRRYWRNSSPSDPVGNEIQLVGFERPGIRRFYDPPVLWVPAITELSEGYQWTWIGRMWPESTEADADTLYFRAEGQESVELLDGGSLLAWKIRVQAGPDFPLAAQGAVDLTGWPMAVRKKTFDPLHYWYGAFNDEGPHRLRLRDDAVLFVPDLSTPVREESMGGLRARFAPGTSGERHR